jgi:hypothetical protein
VVSRPAFFMYNTPVRALFERYIKPIQHHLLTLAFLFGFVVDNFTLKRIDQLLDNLILAGYVVLALLGLLFLYGGPAGRFSEWGERYAPYAPMVVQFAFGGLMSGLLVFYSRSGSWFESWPYLLLILAVILGNELITKRAQRLIFNLSILFVGLFSYVVLVVPVVLGQMSDFIFLLSGVLAFALILLFVRVLYAIVPNFMALNTRNVLFSLGITYATLNTLYFLNLIPPIPLSLKHMGIYHNVEKLADGSYQLRFERGVWWELWKESDTTFHHRPGERVYCYASVFAPTRLSTTVYHRWEFYDPKGGWTFHERIPYQISGGRDAGYRGYTYIQSVQEGKWRCSVENGRGQVIGRTSFWVEEHSTPEAVVTRVDV